MVPLEAAATLPIETVGAIVAAVATALVGGGATHAWHRRRTNGSSISSGATHAQAEVLRQQLYEQRHQETLRVLGDVSATAESAATASRSAAEAAARAATATERMASSLERHLDRCDRRAS